MKRIWQIVIIIAILTTGFFSAYILLKTKPKAIKKSLQTYHTPVNVLSLKKTNHTPKIDADGIVRPAQKINLQAQISGKVLWKNPNFALGNEVKKEEILAKIEATEYRLRLEREKGNLQSAHLKLKIEQAQQEVARRDFENYPEALKSGAKDIALRKPHLKEAQALVKAAQSAVELAQLNLERTNIKAPFNAIIKEDFVQPGSLISPSTPIATLIGTDAFWVMLSIPIHQLPFINLPTKQRDGAEVAIVQQLSTGESIAKTGKIIKLLGELDTLGHMAQAIVEIKNPLLTQSNGGISSVPIFIGAQINAEIYGKPLSNIFLIPQAAFYKDHVWIVQNDRLKKIALKPLWQDKEYIYVKRGVKNGTKLVINRLAAPTQDLPVKIVPTVNQK